MTVDALRFQGSALKPGMKDVRLSQLQVDSVSVPASVLAISLDAAKSVAESMRTLLVVATRFAAEGSLWARAPWSDQMLDEGALQQVMQAGRFRFRVRAPKRARVRALDFTGAPMCEIPAAWRDGWLDLDTSRLEWGTPYFEIDAVR